MQKSPRAVESPNCNVPAVGFLSTFVTIILNDIKKFLGNYYHYLYHCLNQYHTYSANTNI